MRSLSRGARFRAASLHPACRATARGLVVTGDIAFLRRCSLAATAGDWADIPSGCIVSRRQKVCVACKERDPWAEILARTELNSPQAQPTPCRVGFRAAPAPAKCELMHENTHLPSMCSTTTRLRFCWTSGYGPIILSSRCNDGTPYGNLYPNLALVISAFFGFASEFSRVGPCPGFGFGSPAGARSVAILIVDDLVDVSR